jgi:hypothetical protein
MISIRSAATKFLRGTSPQHVLLRGLSLNAAAAASSQSYVCGPGDRPLTNLTIGQVVEQSDKRFGDRVGFVSAHQGIRKTFSELREEVEKLAAGLLTLGLKPGERIGLWGPSTYEWYLTWLATSKAGFILVRT